MLHPERIPMTEAENAAVDALIEKHGDELQGFTRRDPGDTGPLLVHAGEDTYEIAEDGEVTTP